MGQFLLGFLSNYAPPYPCHSICKIDFNTIEPAFVAQSASGYFLLARAKHIGSGEICSLNAFRPLLWPGDFVGDDILTSAKPLIPGDTDPGHGSCMRLRIDWSCQSCPAFQGAMTVLGYTSKCSHRKGNNMGKFSLGFRGTLFSNKPTSTSAISQKPSTENFRKIFYNGDAFRDVAVGAWYST